MGVARRGGRNQLRRRWRWRRLLALALGLIGIVGGIFGFQAYQVEQQRRGAQWSRIESAFAANRFPEAEVLLTSWLDRSPTDGRALVLLAAAHGRLGRPTAAEETLRRVSQGDKVWPTARFMLGELAERRSDIAEAERAFRDAAALDRSAVEPRRRLVYLLTLQHRFDEARPWLWELYELTRELRHLVTIGLGLEAVETDARGLGTTLDDAAKLDPENPWLHRARGLEALRTGRLDEALTLLEEAAAAIERDPAGRMALAECWRLKHDPRQALLALGEEPDRPADRARWWTIRGEMNEAAGRLDEAVEDWHRAVAIDPQARTAWYRIGQAWARRGDLDAASAPLENAETIRRNDLERKLALQEILRGPADAAACERIATLCRNAGRNREARAWLEQAIDREPSRASAQAALARLPASAITPGDPPRLRARRFAPNLPPDRPAPTGDRLRVRLEDVAAEAGVDFTYRSGASGNLYLGDTMGGGVSLLDYDGDGWLDIYLVNGCPLPCDPAAPGANKLYRNRGDGTFEDATARAGVPGRGYGMGCAVGDYDGDGHDDLFVTGLGSTILYRNRGDGTFADQTGLAGVGSNRWTTAAGFADLDGDGDLDLVAVTYVDADPVDVPDCRDPAGHRIHCPPGRFPSQPDHLFRNNGDGTFTDVAPTSGFEAPEGLGLGLAIADLDGDGALDVFIANDAAPDHLFRNLGGLKFAEVGVASGVAYDGSGRATASMGVVADDLDGDGRVDLFHTNFLNEPNTLLHNLGSGLFTDETLAAGLDAASRPATGFGAAALDLENDGDLDLFVANGHVDDQPWLDSPMAQPPLLFVASRPGRFALAPEDASPYLARRVVGRGVAAGDLDNDGRVDLVVVHRDAPLAVLRNRSAAGHWISLRLRSPASAGPPVGAMVRVEAGGYERVRWQTGGTGYLSAGDSRIHIGLGGSEVVDRLDVRWPSGRAQSWSKVKADRVVDLLEGEEAIAP